MTNRKIIQRAVLNRWMKRFVGQIGHSIYPCRYPIHVAVINLSFVICHLSFAAAPADPAAQLHSEVDQVLALAYSGQSSETLVERARPLLERDFSFELVTRQPIGPSWSQFKVSNHQKITDFFTR